MRCTMATGKCTCLLLLHLALTSAFSVPHATQSKGRKLFGGYRIVPKVCQPSVPTRVRSDEPAICMFNYECTRRNGEVVGACMDGFLFGACCQLPSKTNANGPADRLPSTSSLLHRPIDHVPDIPILLNPDGTPLGMTISQSGTTIKTGNDMSNHLHEETAYTKLSTFRPSPTTSSASSHTNDVKQNAEKTQLPTQPDLSNIMQDFPALLGQQNVLDELNLPGLLTHSGSNNDIQDHQDSSAMNPVTTLLSPDQILQIADPVDQLPALFSHGLSQNNHSAADTILLNENGTVLDESHNPDELFKPSTESSVGLSTQVKRVTHPTTTMENKTKVTQSVAFTYGQTSHSSMANQGSSTQWVKFSEQTQPTTPPYKSTTQNQKLSTSSMSKLPVVTQMLYTNTQKHISMSQSTKSESVSDKSTTVGGKSSLKLNATVPLEVTTPMTTSVTKNDLVRVPTITYDVQSGNKKDDVIDKEEIAINHIISILNNTTPGAPDTSVTVQGLSSPIHTWINVDGTSKQPLIKISTSKSPSSTTTYPYTFYKPALPSTYHNYESVSTETSYASHSTPNLYSSSVSPSTKISYDGSTNAFGYSTRPTTHPPAPTVIVLGPLGTEYTTETTQKTGTKRPTYASTKPVQRPSQSTTRPTVAPIRITSMSTKKPSVSTTITHNISTVISSVASNNVVSTSFISVNLKDGTSTRPSTTATTGFSTEAVVVDTPEDRVTTRKPIWTTISSWSDKPSFHLKPSTPNFSWPVNNMTPLNTLYFKDPIYSTTTKTTSNLNCDEETAAPDDLINFPPVRNPNLNTSQPISQQEKPTIVETMNNTGYPDIELLTENDIPTPTFIEDDVLTNKVDAFVNKIVESLQGNFQELKDIVYNRNASTPAPATVTKRPTAAGSSGGSTTKKPVRKPSTSKPSQVTTRRPVTTKRPGGRPTSQKPSASAEKPARPSKPTTSRPTRPVATTASVTTKRPQGTTKRPRPTRRPTTTPVVTEAAVAEEAANSVETTEVTSTAATEASSAALDFRTQCGVRPLAKSGRIVGGKGAKFGEWPWQVLVRETTWLGLFTKNKCGGVLITDKYVITAAHCQPGFLASLVAVFGEYDISGELEPKRSVTRNVRRVTVNRGYDPATFENDLALLELESPVQFDAHVVPICMPDDGADFTGRLATVTGWGRLKYNGGVPSVLQEVQVPIMENAVCQEMFQTAGHSKLILDSFLCAGYANGQKDSCEGDSGGPLVMERPDGRWILVGTVSHGIKCAAPYLPGVYMRTTYFKPWLHSITGV